MLGVPGSRGSELPWMSLDTINCLHNILSLNIKALVDSVSMGCKVCIRILLRNINQSLFEKQLKNGEWICDPVIALNYQTLQSSVATTEGEKIWRSPQGFCKLCLPSTQALTVPA